MKRKAEEDSEALQESLNSGTRVMQGQQDEDKKHSMDSDDEDEEEKIKKKITMNQDDYEGQEDETVRNDGDIAITPFNLKDEASDGTFTKEGDFIWNKKEELKDSWLDNVDWSSVSEVSKKRQKQIDIEGDAEDEAAASYDEKKTYTAILDLLKPGETVAKALRRLGGNKKIKSSDRWKKKIPESKMSPEELKATKDRESMLKLTGLADDILSRSGNMEVYEDTYEKISFKLKELNKKVPSNDDDALDMFADSIDNKESTTESKAIDINEEVMWEFKWTNDDSAELHGPHKSTEMLEWQESGFFDSGCFVRKIGSKDFSSSKRVDFELYT